MQKREEEGTMQRRKVSFSTQCPCLTLTLCFRLIFNLALSIVRKLPRVESKPIERAARKPGWLERSWKVKGLFTSRVSMELQEHLLQRKERTRVNE